VHPFRGSGSGGTGETLSQLCTISGESRLRASGGAVACPSSLGVRRAAAAPGGFVEEVEDRHGGIVKLRRHAGVVAGEPGFGSHACSIAGWEGSVK